MTSEVRVELPSNLRLLERAYDEIAIPLNGAVTQRAIIDALEAKYPMLQGTIRDHISQRRRPFIRFFACGQDLSHDSPDAELPERVSKGIEPFMIVGAIAGG